LNLLIFEVANTYRLGNPSGMFKFQSISYICKSIKTKKITQKN
jgi:hypothetical protein